MAGRVGDRSVHLGVSAFASYVAWLAKAYVVVPILELHERLSSRKPVGGLAALTFDDGYVGTVRHAVPVLRAASLPYALFPVPRHAASERPFWWDVLGERGEMTLARRQTCLTELRGDGETILGSDAAPTVPEELKPAPWTALRSALGPDCTIGSHTMTHRNLVTLTRGELETEFTESRAQLLRHLGVEAEIVSYPYGLATRAVRDVARECGFRSGLGLDFGLNRYGIDPLDIRRINVPAGLPLSTLACWGAGLGPRH
jgi:peptidoglycan/xylan/chitin deacetylase (PgdA/CDA1 family)